MLLVRGNLWITARVRRDGPITLDYSETPLWAYTDYQTACQDLAAELTRHRLTIDHADALGPEDLTRQAAALFIVREAAELLLGQARMSLTVTLQGADRITRHTTGKALKLHRMARSIYTDTGALNRARDRTV